MRSEDTDVGFTDEAIKNYPWAIPVTMYSPGNVPVQSFMLTDEQNVHDHAQALIDAGFHIEFEYLLTNQCSITVGDDNGDYACHIFTPSLWEAKKEQAAMSTWLLAQTVEKMQTAAAEQVEDD